MGGGAVGGWGHLFKTFNKSYVREEIKMVCKVSLSKDVFVCP